MSIKLTAWGAVPLALMFAPCDASGPDLHGLWVLRAAFDRASQSAVYWHFGRRRPWHLLRDALHLAVEYVAGFQFLLFRCERGEAKVQFPVIPPVG